MPATSAPNLASRMGPVPAGLEIPAPGFDFDLGLARNYPDALVGDDLLPVGENDVRREALGTGRVLVLGNGGSGKTSLLSRMWRHAAQNGQFATWIDLRAWREVVPSAGAWPDNDEARADLLLERLGEPSVRQAELDLAPVVTSPLILLDGINEVPNAIAELLIGTADYIASRNPTAGVILTDRLVRRSALGRTWKLIRLVAAREHGKDAAPDALLRNAFFLNLSLQGELKGAGASASEGVELYLTRHVGLTPEELDATASAAVEAYRQDSRSFELGAFRATAGEDAVTKLITAGALLVEGDRAIFFHQLMHDFLVAWWLASRPDEWVPERFDDVTFKASSFDVLALTLERVPSSSLVDLLIRRVYDWNYYGAAYTLARAQQLGHVNVSATMRLALLAMLGDRQWDPVVATADRVKDALRIVGDELAMEILAASDHNSLRRIVANQPRGDALLERWRSLFLRDPGQPVDGNLIAALDDEESLIGWTAANILRRSKRTTDHVQMVVGRVTSSAIPVVRWRAAHVLGGWSTPQGHAALEHAIAADENSWVRYGAIRSLIDNAAEDVHHREALLGWIRDELGRLREGPPQVLIELERSLERDPAPTSWRSAVSDLVEDAYATAEDQDEAQRWRRLARALRDLPNS